MKTLKKSLLVILLPYFHACGGLDSSAPSVSNQEPSANFFTKCEELFCNFTSSATDDDGTIVSYHWTIDGNTFESKDVKVTFENFDTYDITHTVTDDRGLTGTKSIELALYPDFHDRNVIIDINSSSIIFEQNFEHRPNGEYSGEDLSEDFCMTRDEVECSFPSKDSIGEVTIQNGELKVTFLSRDNLPGKPSRFDASFYLYADYQELWLTYDLRFDNEYDFGGSLSESNLAADIKIMGIGARSQPGRSFNSPTGCVTVAEDEGFSYRFLTKRSHLSQYIYHQDKSGSCGDDNYILVGDNRFQFQPDTQYTLEVRAVMNSPFLHNGYFETFINGFKAGEVNGLSLSQNGVYGINEFIFALYAGVDQLTFDSTIYLDNFFLSTERVVEKTN